MVPDIAEMRVVDEPLMLVEPLPDAIVVPSTVGVNRNHPGIGAQFIQVPNAAVLVEPAHLTIDRSKHISGILIGVFHQLVHRHAAIDHRFEVRAGNEGQRRRKSYYCLFHDSQNLRLIPNVNERSVGYFS